MTPDTPKGTVLGTVILSILIAGAGGWLYLQGQASTSTREASRSPADAWPLPDDPLAGFVEIPAGPFLMGSDPAADPESFDNERWPGPQPQQTVDLPAFLLGRHEVTVGEFRAFAEATGYRADPRALVPPPSLPVVNVSWTDALAYGRWIESVLKASPRTPPALRSRLADGWRVTLPNEAQWEKAARGADGRRFPWGHEPRTDRANFRAAGPVPVGSYPCPECPFDVRDMSGNVWEWTRSPFQPYPFDPSDDRQHLDADALWVMRGGSFSDPDQNVRAAVRGGGDPGVRRPFIGFRIAIAAP